MSNWTLTCERCGRQFQWIYPYEGEPMSPPRKCKRTSCKGTEKRWRKKQVKIRAAENEKVEREVGGLMREKPRGELYPF